VYNAPYQARSLMGTSVEHVIYEKNADIGGTWLENRYPGAACDIASHTYTYNFALKYVWYSPQAIVIHTKYVFIVPIGLDTLATRRIFGLTLTKFARRSTCGNI
jgi:hypothetical protein